MTSCNIGCNYDASKIVTTDVTTSHAGRDNFLSMDRKYGKTFIREWRQHRGLSLRRLADRLELDGPDETFSHASIGRIEKGQQPYSQPVLEAIAHALDVEVQHLLSVDPTKEGQVVDLIALLREKDPDTVRAILQGLPSKDAKAG